MRHLPQWVNSVPIYVSETPPYPHPKKILYVENDFQYPTMFADRFLVSLPTYSENLMIIETNIIFGEW